MTTRKIRTAVTRRGLLRAGAGMAGILAAGSAPVYAQTQPKKLDFANILGALPKSAHPGAKKAFAEIWNAEDRRQALDAVKSFEAAYGTKFAKAVAKITDDLEVLLAFLRLSRRALDSPAHDQPHRINFRDRTTPDEDHAGSRLASRRPGDGVQTHQGRAGPLARREHASLCWAVRREPHETDGF